MRHDFMKVKKIFVFLLLIAISSVFFAQSTNSSAGFAEEEFRRGVQAFYRGSFNDAILQFEKALAYLPEEGLILDWLGKAYYRAGLESAAIQQWQYALELGYGGQLLENVIEILKVRRVLEDSFDIEERYVESSNFFGVVGENLYFGNPMGILPCDDGTFWVTAFNTNELVLFDVNGTIIDRKRGPLNGFDGPMDIKQTPEGNILVTEFNGDRISVLDKNCNYLFSFGSKGRGNGEFLGPQYIAIDSNHNIFVTDYGNGRVCVFDKDGNPLFTFGKFVSPTGIAILNDVVYVVDSIEGNILSYDIAGNYIGKIFAEKVFQSPESISVVEDYLVVCDLNKVYACEPDSGSITEIASTGNAPARLVAARIDENSNLITSDFKGNQVFLLSRMSELIGGLYVEIVRVNADNFPQVSLEVKVENRRREPVVGLKDINFLITENKYNVSNQTLTGAAYKNDVCDITLIIDRNISMKKFETEVATAIKEIAAAMKGKGTLRIVCDGAIPSTELVVNPSSVTNFQVSKLQTPYSNKSNTDLAIRLASNDLVNAELKRGIIYITDSSENTSNFTNYSLTDLANYMNNNEISFSVVSVEPEAISSELEFLVENTMGSNYYVYRPEGIATVVDNIYSLASGVYTFTFTSSLPTNFGRDYIPVEVEAYLLNRSGRAETGYYAPLQ